MRTRLKSTYYIDRPFFLYSAPLPPPLSVIPQVQRDTFASNHTRRHTLTLRRTPLARRRDHYLPTRNIYKRQTFKSPTGFEPAIPACERPQTHASDSTATRFALSVSVILNSLPGSTYTSRSPTILLRPFAVNEIQSNNYVLQK